MLRNKRCNPAGMFYVIFLNCYPTFHSERVQSKLKKQRVIRQNKSAFDVYELLPWKLIIAEIYFCEIRVLIIAWIYSSG